MTTSSNPDTITIPTPTMGTEESRVAELLADAAWKLRNGYTAGGSTVTGSVAQLCDNAAKAIDPNVRTHYAGLYPPANGRDVEADIQELTYEERCALPARYHLPVYDGLGEPNSWMCKVCWCADEALTTAWPCPPAQHDGHAVAHAAGLEFSR